MSTNPNGNSSRKSLAAILPTKKYWWMHSLSVARISGVGLLYLGFWTYTGAPPPTELVCQP